ncbi:hypothetical protein [Serratia fonticola]|uniref:hypothetical protein n=1 Tax=Serratia fonticola TaxID=47917 RepID=UPI001378F704|nr:hypothetical protein [Serratia fonticola]NCG53662.1 hypothetical protein [Serratia fonticola]
MLTHKVMKEEIEALRMLVIKGECELPSFWRCGWPALAFIVLNYIWADFVTHGHPFNPTFTACIFAVMIYASRMMYLTLPKAFRESSITVKSMTTRVVVYGCILVLGLFFCGLMAISDNPNFSRDYDGTSFMMYFIWGVIFILDMNRYQLSGFAAALTLLKSRKQGGE